MLREGLVLCGEWADKSSLLGARDLLARICSVVTDWNVDSSLTPPAVAPQTFVLVCGGKPKELLKTLGRRGRTNMMRLLREKQCVFVGICAGVKVAKEMGLMQGVELVNDEEWALSGICLEDVLLDGWDGSHPSFLYENGPLMKVCSAEVKVMATFATDAAQVFENQHRLQTESKEGKDTWICKQCFTHNPPARSKCFMCSELRTHKLPPVGEMPGTAAIVVVGSQLILCSVHPELSQDRPESFNFFLSILGKDDT
jgi:ribosomal protein L40E